MKNKITLKNEEQATAALQAIRPETFTVASVKHGERKVSPAPPFTTSTMQQEASRKLGFSSKRTMKAAQE